MFEIRDRGGKSQIHRPKYSKEEAAKRFREVWGPVTTNVKTRGEFGEDRREKVIGITDGILQIQID